MDRLVQGQISNLRKEVNLMGIAWGRVFFASMFGLLLVVAITLSF